MRERERVFSGRPQDTVPDLDARRYTTDGRLSTNAEHRRRRG